MTASRQSSRRLFWVTFVLMVLALALGFYAKQQESKEQKPVIQLNATVLPIPKKVVDFELTDNHGKMFTQKNLQDHWSFIFFGFTNCKNICPTTMAMLDTVYQDILNDHKSPQPQVVFISVDPTHDTVKKVNGYVQSFNKDFMGLTGDKKTIANLASSLGVTYQTADKDNIIHSGSILLLDPNGNLHAIFSAPFNNKNIVADYDLITANKD